MDTGHDGTRRGTGRTPFADDYVDPRTPEQLAADRRRVCRQVTGLGRSKAEESFRRELTAEVQHRRGDRSDLVQFDLVQDRRGRPVAVVRGELLVRSDITEDTGVMSTLGRYGFDSRPVAALDDRLLRLFSPTLPSGRLPDIARLVRREGHQVSVNYITPLGPVMKGRGGPEPTEDSRPYPPSFAETAPSGATVRVAVIDTGITAAPRSDGWLQGLADADNIDLLDDLPQPGDGFLDFGAGHGTFAAGVVAQVSPATGLDVYRAIDTDGVGSEVDVAVAMVRGVQKGATVLNLSLGTPTLDDQPLLAIEVALDLIEERHPEVLVVAAAGNEGNTRPVWPAASKRVVAVGGLTADLTPAPWSSSGFWVDCSTVGEGVLSTFVTGQESADLDPDPDTWGKDPWAVWSGTSFAAPQISGAVARIAAEQSLPPREALKVLLAGARQLPDFGRVVRLLPGT